MFNLDNKSKLILCFSLLFAFGSVAYLFGYYHGATNSIPKKASQLAENDISPQKDTRLGISADLFIPNFNAFSDRLHISSYQNVQNDFIEFGNNSQSIIIIGKGNPKNLDSIGVIFPKYDTRARIDGLTAIYATISAVSPSTTDAGRGYIGEQLGLDDDIDNKSGMKISEYNGKRYAVTYEQGKVTFMSMTQPE